MHKTDFVHLKNGQSVSQTALDEAYKVVAVRQGRTVNVSRIYPNKYVDEEDPAYYVTPSLHKRCPLGTYSINEYQAMVSASGDLVRAF
jgi:hypothetical protein